MPILSKLQNLLGQGYNAMNTAADNDTASMHKWATDQLIQSGMDPDEASQKAAEALQSSQTMAMGSLAPAAAPEEAAGELGQVINKTMPEAPSPANPAVDKAIEEGATVVDPRQRFGRIVNKIRGVK